MAPGSISSGGGVLIQILGGESLALRAKNGKVRSLSRTPSAPGLISFATLPWDIAIVVSQTRTK